MAEYVSIPISKLFLDTTNPRLEERERSQRDAIREMAVSQKQKIINLAVDIVEHGLNPSEILIVVPYDGTGDEYSVLEGNRRLVAIKLLEDPEIVEGIFSRTLFHKIKALNQVYQNSPIEAIQCVLVDDKNDAQHWIELRHITEQNGVGIVGWGGEETARFRQRYGQKEVSLQILDFLETEGFLTRQERSGLRVTNLKRVVEGKEAREKIGYTIEKGVFIPGNDKPRIATLLKRIVIDFSTNRKSVKDVYLKTDRIRYLDEIIADEVKKPKDDETSTCDTDSVSAENKGSEAPSTDSTREASNQAKNSPNSEQTNNASSPESQDSGNSSPANQSTGSNSTKDNNRSTSNSKSRTTDDGNRQYLIPKSCRLTIPNPRINEIYQELKKLSLSEFPNAVAVLLRVFLELSVDYYIYQNQSEFRDPGDSNYKLQAKMIHVTDHLEKQGRIKAQEAVALRHAATYDHNKISYIDLLNQYIHNQYLKPSIEDLRVRWDNLEILFVTIWG
jgi:hypothetical protein